ncbi:MAG TPA: Fe-S cluster assembly protein SufD [Gemmatimonadaceae bacterium]|nr:Fe-S cluster assembly protein SufD [Gemmatimonadaceae bacterium]
MTERPRAHAASMDAYRADFERLMSSDFSGEPEWVKRFRAQSMESFETLGFPTMKDEDWHYTSVAPIADRVFHSAEVSIDDFKGLALSPVPPADIVFLNGRLVPLKSQDVRGLTVQSLAEAIRTSPSLENEIGAAAKSTSSAFNALNGALFRDGALIRIAPDTQAGPIHIVHLTTAEGRAVQTRNIIVGGRHSSATVIESYFGEGAYFTNAVTEVILDEGARVVHYKLQNESDKAFHIGTTQAKQPRNSYFESFAYSSGAELSRTNTYTILEGDAAECVLNGLYLADGTQHMDHQTYVEHVAPNCPSHELYKGILDGRSHGVFNGKVYVHPEAQKTDGKQSNNNLLLSEHARIDTKPQLEIFADDVKCTHGATVGRLDETALFYLQSRGLGKSVARKLLTYAFAADVLERLSLASLKETLEARVLERFTG